MTTHLDHEPTCSDIVISTRRAAAGRSGAKVPADAAPTGDARCDPSCGYPNTSRCWTLLVMTVSDTSTEADRGQRIIVGVDGSAGASVALRWALQEARLRQVPVHVVFAWTFHPSGIDPGLGSMFPTDGAVGGGIVPMLPPTEAGSTPVIVPSEPAAGGLRDVEVAAQQALEAAIDTALAQEPTLEGIDVIPEAVQGHPAHVLLEAATPADLLVVGSRGHGQFAAALLGSISHHVVTHASCPVVVVPQTA
jgi:nucleotide-binding universal stress UspA family protein